MRRTTSRFLRGGLPFLFASTLFLIAPPGSADDARIWTVPGRPGVKALLISRDEANAVLRTADGKQHTVPIARLSPEDQHYLANLGKAPAPGAPAPVGMPAAGEFGEIRQTLNPEQLALLDTTLDQVFSEKSWKAYQELVTGAAHQLAFKLQPELGAQTYLNVINEASFFSLVAQERFLETVPDKSLSTLLESAEKESFLRWLLGRPEVIEDFLIALDPADNPDQAFEIWYRCWESVPETQAEFANVAIACALVFDRKQTVKTTIKGPKPEIDPVDRCRHFIDAAKKGSLQTRLNEMPVHELVWVVCADVTTEDLEWARSSVSLSQKNMGRAYPMIEYLMERATDNTNPYETYRLEEIKEMGGVCRDQAHFASNVARAHGVPAFVITGDGDRGAHAWMGYKVGRGEWDSNTGRYQGYRTGVARSPQTNQPVREQLFALWNESEFNDADKFKAGHRLVWWSEIYRAMEKPHAEVALAEMASEAAPHSPAVLERRIESLAAFPDSTEQHWKDLIADIRRAFREHPDLLARAAELETKFISIDDNFDELVSSIESERRNILRKDSERSDLLVVLYRREADLAIHRKDFDEVLDVYKGAFKKLSGDVPAFKQLAKDLVACVGQADDSNFRSEAIDMIEGYFEKDIETGGGDYFRQESEAGVRKMIEKMKAES